MIKDYGNQKLPRFVAGKALLDQVTAERLNDICSMVEANRVQNGVGYMLNRTANGTTLNINQENNRPPKLWRIDLNDIPFDPLSILSTVLKWASEELVDVIGDVAEFTSIFEELLNTLSSSITSGEAGSASGIEDFYESYLSPINAIIDGVDAKVDELLNKTVPIQSTLVSFFDKLGRKPRSGDMIYTDEFGIVYTIFREQEDDEGAYPTQNLIFRVPFTLGITEEDTVGTTFYALTTFPMPDIAECVKTIIEMFTNFVLTLIGTSLEGLVQAILNAMSKALNDLYEILLDLIQDIEVGSIPSLDDIINDIASLQDEVESLSDRIFGEDDSDTTKSITDELAELSTSLRDLLSTSTEISWIDKDGNAKQGKLPVSDLVTLSSQLKQEVSWIDAPSGSSYVANALIWDKTETTGGFSSSRVEYMGPDGYSYQNTFLIKLDDVQYQRDIEEAEPVEVEFVGADGNSYKTTFVKIITANDSSNSTGKIEPTEVEVCEDGESTTKIFLEKKQ